MDKLVCDPVCIYIETVALYTDMASHGDIPIPISTSSTRYCFLNVMICLKGTRAPISGSFQAWDKENKNDPETSYCVRKYRS